MGLTAGADVNAEGCIRMRTSAGEVQRLQAIDWAVWKSHATVVQTLLDAAASVNNLCPAAKIRLKMRVRSGNESKQSVGIKIQKVLEEAGVPPTLATEDAEKVVG